jgi:hypothetical protein
LVYTTSNYLYRLHLIVIFALRLRYAIAKTKIKKYLIDRENKAQKTHHSWAT